jgi:Kef-type K+ transport system membrane component KefB
VRRGTVATAVTVIAAAALAPLVAWAGHLHRPAVVAVLLAATSAAVALPIIEEPTGRRLLVLVAWVAIADVVTVLAVPFVLSRDGLGRAVTGSILILGTTAVIGILGGRLRGTAPVEALRAASKRHGFAIDLRLSLLVLFGLAWMAERFDTTVLIAGFAAGAMVAALGPPRRVAEQLIGLGEGFFVPLFFVVLGARLDLRALFRSHEDLGLLALLTVGAVVVHVIAAICTGLRPAYGLVASAQLGVPSAVATIGLASGALRPGQAAAIIGAAAASLAVAAIGAALSGLPHGGNGRPERSPASG